MSVEVWSRFRIRLGAKEEGTVRKHLVTWTGRILDTEWSEVKTRLKVRLDFP